MLLTSFRYPSSEELIRINRIVLEEIKIRKADRPQVLSTKGLQSVIEITQQTRGDIYDKAVTLLTELVRKHPFASGNRRTAYVALRFFLEANGQKMKVAHDPKVLLGIREEFYGRNEIKAWLKGSAIREFKRG